MSDYGYAILIQRRHIPSSVISEWKVQYSDLKFYKHSHGQLMISGDRTKIQDFFMNHSRKEFRKWVFESNNNQLLVEA